MYKNILVAIDLSSDTQSIIANALRMAGSDPSKLNLVHVVEPVAGAYSMDIYALNIGELQQEAIAFAEQPCLSSHMLRRPVVDVLRLTELPSLTDLRTNHLQRLRHQSD